MDRLEGEQQQQQQRFNPFLFCGGDHVSCCFDESHEPCFETIHHHQMSFLHLLHDRGGFLQQQLEQEPTSFQLLLRLQEEQLLHKQIPQPPLPPPPPKEERKKHCKVEPTDTRTLPPSSLLEPDSCVTESEPTAAAPAAPPEGGAAAGKEAEQKKRKRSRTKKTAEAESQRMSHIAVERNRRRLMNDHLCALRSIMPPSYVQRGDQASVVGGAIDFVKELEQHLQSLQAEKQMRSEGPGAATTTTTTSPFDGFFTSPQYAMQRRPSSPPSTPSSSSSSSSVSAKVEEDEVDGGDDISSGGGSSSVPGVAEIEATVIQTHVNLRVMAPRQPGQLLKAIAALEELQLTVLHLNITSLQNYVLYCLNLRMEEECKLGSADEIATAAHEIFSCINGSS